MKVADKGGFEDPKLLVVVTGGALCVTVESIGGAGIKRVAFCAPGLIRCAESGDGPWMVEVVRLGGAGSGRSRMEPILASNRTSIVSD